MTDHDPCALESLKHHGRSPFYMELIECLQNTLDVLSEPYSPNTAMVRKTFADLKLQARIGKIIHTHTGFTLIHLNVIDIMQPGAQCRMYLPEFKSVSSTGKLGSRGMIVSAIDAFYDDKLGKLSSPSIDTNLVKMDIRIYTGCFIKDNGSFVFTADELAAIILHEVGHVDTYIRSAFRTQTLLLDGAEIVEYLKESPDPKIVRHLITLIQNNKDKLPKEWVGVLPMVSKYFEQHPNSDDGMYTELLNLLSVLVESRAGEYAKQQYLTNTLKSSQFNTLFIHGYNERNSDEYATRHGAGAGLIGYLSKTESLRSDQYDLLHSTMYNADASLFLRAMRIMDHLFVDRVSDLIAGYDIILVRLANILETQKHAFSNSNLSARDALVLEKDIVDGMDYLKQVKSYKGSRMRERIDEWRARIEKTGRIVSSPFQNRLSEDYDRLQRATRSLSRNPLYYLAKK